jgi:hypothetical protein
MSGPRYPKCIFCEKTDSPQHKEDILAKWLARELAAMADTKVAFMSKTGRLGDPDWPGIEYGAVGKLGWETKGPCQRCNNGWMSTLENQARPVLRPMIRGHSCTLSSGDLTVVAQWITKTTIMWEYMKYRSGRFFSRSDRVALFASMTVPRDTYIYAARYLGGEPVYTIGGPMRVHFSGSSTEASGYCATLAIGQLALQILCFKRPEHVDETLNIRIPARWDPVHKPVWPIPPGWSWPPSVVLMDDDEFKRFATRVPVQIT